MTVPYAPIRRSRRGRLSYYVRCPECGERIDLDLDDERMPNLGAYRRHYRKEHT